MGNVFRTTHLSRINSNLDYYMIYYLCEFSHKFLQMLNFGLLVGFLCLFYRRKIII